MKKVILLLSTAISLLSCNETKKDSHIIRIEKEIRTNALGMDIGYTEGKLDTIVVVDTKTALVDLGKQWEIEFPKELPTAISHYTEVYERAQKENDINTFHVWKNITERLKRLKQMKPNQIDYSVYRFNYTVNNGLNPKAGKVEVVNYYFFNHLDSLVGQIDETKLKEAQKQYIKTELQPYDLLKVSLETGIEM